MSTESVDRSDPRSREALAFASARVLGLAINTALSLFLVRALDVREFGAYSAATGVFLLISSLSYMGCDQLLLAGRLPTGHFSWLVPRLGGMTALLAILGALAWPGLPTDARITLAILGITRGVDLQRGLWLLGPQLSRLHLRRARRELAAQVAIAVSVVTAVLLDADAISAACGGLVSSLVLTALVRASTERAPADAARPSIWTTLSAGVGFASSSILYTAVNASGLVLVPLLASIEDVARYRAAMLVFAATLVLPVAVNNDLMRPHLYRSATEAGAPASSLRGNMLLINLLLGAAVALVLLFGVRPLVGSALGDEYRSVRILLVPLSLAAPLAFVSSYVANRLIVRGGLGSVVRAQAAMLVLAVAANVVFVRSSGATGAAWAVFLVEAFGVVVYLIVWRRREARGSR